MPHCVRLDLFADVPAATIILTSDGGAHQFRQTAAEIRAQRGRSPCRGKSPAPARAPGGLGGGARFPHCPGGANLGDHQARPVFLRERDAEEHRARPGPRSSEFNATKGSADPASVARARGSNLRDFAQRPHFTSRHTGGSNIAGRPSNSSCGLKYPLY